MGLIPQGTMKGNRSYRQGRNWLISGQRPSMSKEIGCALAGWAQLSEEIVIHFYSFD